MKIEARELYTTEEVARYLRVSMKTMERWRKIGHGPAVLRLFPGGRPMYRGKDIIAAVERGLEYGRINDDSADANT